ncbi:ASCH domain-containing protein [Pectobacterium carotovorum]|uniref:ASCH domain-containing protein n=1 Tax=Pectobacterium carotovorum TaxID=554 RepID=UPI001E650408|nr:ASCH domain-containing protein [Pectobacterium carotovorum]UFT92849.1 ASCH domain-containing protein [Pectobacterium carotovorum]
MKALSIRQPWAWLIVNGFKGVENRSWHTKYRGPILVHAAKGLTRREYDEAYRFVEGIDPLLAGMIPSFEVILRGGIVGFTHIINSVDQATADPWFVGPKGFILSTSGVLPFTPLKGRLSFFETGLGLSPRNKSFVLVPEEEL